MKISFDLDDTLIPAILGDFPTERRNAFLRLIGIEPIRKGTPILFTRLKQAGHQVGIYTTSHRTKLHIRFHLMIYGISPDFIINEQQNRPVLISHGITSSKYPPAFGIDLHIDDSIGVEQEGKRLGFQVVVVGKNDRNWAKKWKRLCREIELPF